MKYIRAFAPASVSNIACGFDILGFAVNEPGDEVELHLVDEPGVKIVEITGDNGQLPYETELNTVSLVINAYLKHLGLNIGLQIKLHKKMPLKSGLGSSAASSVVGVWALNHMLGQPLTDLQLLPFALLGEELAAGSGHADNVAPALLGGFILVRGYNPIDVVKLPVPPDLICTIVHPHLEVSTKAARAILPQNIPLKLAIEQWGNVAGLVAGVCSNDYALIGRSLHDVIVEPVRASLITGFYEAKTAALAAGALGCSISGSGPTIFALSTSVTTAHKVAATFEQVYGNLNIGFEVYVSSINTQGPRILEVN
jgi:homoserine kinase